MTQNKIAMLEAAADSLNTAFLAAAAVAYAEMGIPVFPLGEGGKLPHPALPYVPDGKGGLWLAHTDTARIQRWWAAHPDSNIGLRTGDVFDVLDVDVKHGSPGWESVARVKHLLGGAFALAHTPTGGGHLLFAPSGDGNHTAGKAGHGLDFRGSGGYIVAAPSIVPEGRYAWSDVTASRFGIPASWDALTAILAPKPERPPFVPRPGHTPRLDGLIRTVAEAKESHRNSTLHWAACRAVDDGLDPWELLPAALAVGLSSTESENTIKSATKRAS